MINTDNPPQAVIIKTEPSNSGTIRLLDSELVTIGDGAGKLKEHSLLVPTKRE